LLGWQGVITIDQAQNKKCMEMHELTAARANEVRPSKRRT